MAKKKIPLKPLAKRLENSRREFSRGRCSNPIGKDYAENKSSRLLQSSRKFANYSWGKFASYRWRFARCGRRGAVPTRLPSRRLSQFSLFSWFLTHLQTGVLAERHFCDSAPRRRGSVCKRNGRLMLLNLILHLRRCRAKKEIQIGGFFSSSGWHRVGDAGDRCQRWQNVVPRTWKMNYFVSNPASRPILMLFEAAGQLLSCSGRAKGWGAAVLPQRGFGGDTRCVGVPDSWCHSRTPMQANTWRRFPLCFWATRVATSASGDAPGRSPGMPQHSRPQHQPKVNFLTRPVGFSSSPPSP